MKPAPQVQVPPDPETPGRPPIKRGPLELSSRARWIFVVVAFAIAALAFLFPLPESWRTVNGLTLSPEGQAIMGILIFALLLWISEAIPFHLTGLLGTALVAIFGVMSFGDVIMIGFGNHIVIFFIGVLVMSSFITRSGLGNRISVFLLSRTGNGTSAIILGFLIVGMFLSMWITNTAVAAMLLPLGVSILKEEGVEPMRSNFGKALMISCAWGPIVGGLMAPSGAGPNPIAIGFLKEMTGIELTFVGWMIYGVPAGVLLLLPTFGILMVFFKPEMKRLKKSKEELKEAYAALPPMSREERITLWLFSITVFLWLTTPLFERLLGVSIPISLPVLLTSCVFFFPGVAKTKWDEVEKEMSWSSIILIVSGISLGMVLYRTGGAEWLAIGMLGGLGPLHPFVMILVVVLIVEFLKVFLSSNTVTATIIIPIMITLAASLGIDALSIALPAALSTSMAFILVTSTPTNVIPYTAGYFSIRDMAVSGLVMTLVAAPIVAGTIFVIGKFSGLY